MKTPIRRSTSLVLRPLGVAVLTATAVSGCTDVPIDDNQPEPRGVIEGTVQYIGRRVDCVGGKPTGRVLMTLVNDANPLPPEGRATAPVDFFAVGGEDLFTDPANECFDAMNPNQVIQRSVAFRWPGIPLGSTYRIQAFYDQEGDFNPLFSVRQAPSAGDVAGGAVENPTSPVTPFSKLAFPPASDPRAENGFLLQGVNVSLGASVVTDAPLMRVTDGDLSSEVPMNPAINPLNLGSYPALDFSMYSRDSADPLRVSLDRTLEAMGMEGMVDFADDLKYAWYIDPLDVDGNGENACGSADLDCHPVLGSLGLQWKSPVVLLQRYRNPIEVAAGIPTVALIPAAGATAGPRVLDGGALRTRVMPLAAVFTNPTDAQCTALYFADGLSPLLVSSAAGALTTKNTLECAELPTGRYGTNVLGGLAITSPTQRVDEPDTNISQTGVVINGGRFGAQLWTLPNELGDAVQVGDIARTSGDNPGTFNCLAGGAASTSDLCVPEQSLAGAVVVSDPNPDSAYSRRAPNATAATCSTYAAELGATTWASDQPNHEPCCAPIRHLCNVPLCPVATVTQTWAPASPQTIRSSPTSGAVNENGQFVPNCIPFTMPQACCSNMQP